MIADDVQWLDQETSEALAFIARRIANDPIILLAAQRDGWSSPLDRSRVPEFRLSRLAEDDAVALVDMHAPGLRASARRWLLREAAGNPLALVELPTTIDEIDKLTPGPWLPLTDRLRETFAGRVRGLPAPTRALLLCCALNDQENLAEAIDAARIFEPSVGLDDLAAAVDAALVDADPPLVRFRHPLMRSAVREQSDMSELTSAHLALAQILVDDPDRAVWHRAAAALATDSGLAADLEEVASRSQQRGGLESAIAALQRAADLSDDQGDRGRRLLRAAGLALELGRYEAATRLLDQSEGLALPASDAARRALIRETSRPSRPDDVVAGAVLIEHASAMCDHEPELALDLLWTAANTGFWGDRGAEFGEKILGVLTRLDRSETDPRGLSIITYAAPIDRGTWVLERIARLSPDSATDARDIGLIANAAVTLGGLDIAQPFFQGSIETLRQQGRLLPLAQTLVLRGWSSIHLGRWEVAQSDAAQAARLSEETRQPIWGAAADVLRSLVLAYRGDPFGAEALLTGAEKIGLQVGARALLNVIQMARGLTALSHGRAADPHAEFTRMFDPADPSYHRVESCWAIGNLAEAAFLTGQTSELRPLLARLEELADRTTSPWFQISMRHARALAAAADAEALYGAALQADLSGVDWFIV